MHFPKAGTGEYSALAETASLTDVLDLPYGFEIYSLLTRWNPLSLDQRQKIRNLTTERMFSSVCLGPAGYLRFRVPHKRRLFGVVGYRWFEDRTASYGMENRRSRAEETCPENRSATFARITEELDERILSGFGGVSEYGITVRWDKNFLTIDPTQLESAKAVSCIYRRREVRRNIDHRGRVGFRFRPYRDRDRRLAANHRSDEEQSGSAAFAKASDFLMALSANSRVPSKKTRFSNLQVRLPAVVIGGGLTGIDTATEMLAYYPVQVEKLLAKYEKIVAECGSEACAANGTTMSVSVLKISYPWPSDPRGARGSSSRGEGAEFP